MSRPLPLCFVLLACSPSVAGLAPVPPKSLAHDDAGWRAGGSGTGGVGIADAGGGKAGTQGPIEAGADLGDQGGAFGGQGGIGGSAGGAGGAGGAPCLSNNAPGFNFGQAQCAPGCPSACVLNGRAYVGCVAFASGAIYHCVGDCAACP